jgi:putative NADH-flavin reductase
MNIAIFGASGATGKLLTERSLALSYNITALVRNPDSFPFKDQVRIIQGSAFDPAAIAATIKGADVVLSALGAKSPFKKEDVLARAVPLIVKSMTELGVKRIVALGSAGAETTSLDKQPAYRRWIVQKIVYNYLLKYPVEEQIAQFKILSASNLDWTMVMPPMLTNSPGRGASRIRIDGDALPRNGARISRSDVAGFMMRQIDSTDWLRKGVYITW